MKKPLFALLETALQDTGGRAVPQASPPLFIDTYN
jgi:hypothetical protein